jgi:hypothetical protein
MSFAKGVSLTHAARLFNSSLIAMPSAASILMRATRVMTASVHFSA